MARPERAGFRYLPRSLLAWGCYKASGAPNSKKIPQLSIVLRPPLSAVDRITMRNIRPVPSEGVVSA